jgi:hypothetical protein
LHIEQLPLWKKNPSTGIKLINLIVFLHSGQNDLG